VVSTYNEPSKAIRNLRRRCVIAGRESSDGRVLRFLLRLLLKYPEILAWEKLWNDGQQSVYATSTS